MNIIKEILTLPKTNGGKKRRYNLLNQLNIEKKDKNEIAKAIDDGNLGGNTSNQDTSNARIIKEYYYLDYGKMMGSGDEAPNVIKTFIDDHFIFGEDYSYFTKIIYKVYTGIAYVYIDEIPPMMSGVPDDAKIAICKYEPLEFIGSGINVTDVYTDIKKLFANILQGYGESIDDFFNEYAISEEEFWKDAVILD